MQAPLESLVAVVGHNGFIGSTVCREVAELGGRVAPVDRRRPLETYTRTDLERLTAVVWMANSISPALAETHPDLVEEDHRALQRAIHALEQRRTPVRFVLTSSGGTVYDQRVAPPHRESTPTAPSTAYAAAKLRLEDITLGSTLETIVLRLSNPYGPGQAAARGQGVIGHWLASIRDGRPITMIGPPETQRDFLFIEDAARAVSQAAITPNPLPPVLNIASGSPTSLGELAEILAKIVFPMPVTIEHRPARPFDRPSAWLDTALANVTLGWSSSTLLRDGLLTTWRSVA